ncbi:MAG: tetratricopeptide repeat protein [Pedosphaera sp.]|nr:tetratricopeptide repeat protein [Pedosphaera sp.]
MPAEAPKRIGCGESRIDLISRLPLTSRAGIFPAYMSSETTDDSSSWFEFLGWIETNKRNLVRAGAGLLILVFVVATIRWKSYQTELAANSALLALKVSVPATATGESAATAGDFLKIVDLHGGTAAAERALLLAAGASFTDGKYTEAQAQFERFLREHGDSALAASAAFGAAAALESQGKSDEALTAYQNFQTRFSRAAQVDQARLSAARIHESKNQHEAAFKVYDELARAGAGTSAASQAAQRKQRLLSAHPELGKTNTPVAAVSTNAPAVKP